jgi:hypothetical protein
VRGEHYTIKFTYQRITAINGIIFRAIGLKEKTFACETIKLKVAFYTYTFVCDRFLHKDVPEMNIPIIDPELFGKYVFSIKPDYNVGRNYEQPMMM